MYNFGSHFGFSSRFEVELIGFQFASRLWGSIGDTILRLVVLYVSLSSTVFWSKTLLWVGVCWFVEGIVFVECLVIGAF